MFLNAVTDTDRYQHFAFTSTAPLPALRLPSPALPAVQACPILDATAITAARLPVSCGPLTAPSPSWVARLITPGMRGWCSGLARIDGAGTTE